MGELGVSKKMGSQQRIRTTRETLKSDMKKWPRQKDRWRPEHRAKKKEKRTNENQGTDWERK